MDHKNSENRAMETTQMVSDSLSLLVYKKVIKMDWLLLLLKNFSYSE
jgi:hypothetical protein